MLVLTIKNGERLFIGPDIEVVVIEAKDGKARLGTVAPREIHVGRDKVKPNAKEPANRDGLQTRLVDARIGAEARSNAGAD